VIGQVQALEKRPGARFGGGQENVTGVQATVPHVTRHGQATEAPSIAVRGNGQMKGIAEDPTDRSAITPEKATGAHPTEHDQTVSRTLSGKPRIDRFRNNQEGITRKRMNAPYATK